ncbi:hypothetical protein LZZ85_13260 [Terrimonas sp. NA20]|uniref:Uncharacterized protein n=1 Tax=Terrimonas ginsenosidimutans TaxID=2908004 RepID=A0ABS9KSF7_9BACT|nr:hypothetical protein [Terrimonas ginsenosidimutans]MCG2615263.1 hypothetical protein [Terrimonas ginsenosidimutans]
MNSHLLYFPYINVPDTGWTYRAILYYDSISSIVPQEYHWGDEEYEPFMRELINHNLVVPLDPMNQMGDIAMDVARTLVNYIHLPEYDLPRKRDAFQQLRHHPAHVPARISTQKFMHELFYQLEKEALAYRYRSRFYDVEPTLARLMMLLLTNRISQRHNLSPVTDDGRHLGVRFVNQVGVQAPEVLRRRDNLLQGIMPGPQFIELSKLLEFKMKYQSELEAFRFMVEDIALDERYDNEHLLENRIGHLNLLREQLTARMTEDKFGKIAGTTLSIGTDLLAATASLDLGGVIAVGKSIAEGVKGMRSNPENIFDATGLKYLALAHKHL